MTKSIFLSASIPDQLSEQLDRGRITEAVLGLVRACRDLNLHLCLRGHPAISPLVHHAAETYGNLQRVTIYQSRHYEKHLPDAAKAFPDLRFTDEGSDEPSSLRIMREAMLNPAEWAHVAAVFIGGTQGVVEDAMLFAERYPNTPMIAMRETGGFTSGLPELLPEIDARIWIFPPAERQANSLPRYYRLYLESLRGLPASKTSPGSVLG